MESILAITAATWAIAMARGPVLQITKIVEHRSSSGNSVGYFLILLVGFVPWTAYGVAGSNPALFIPNAVAVVVTTATEQLGREWRVDPTAAAVPQRSHHSRLRSVDQPHLRQRPLTKAGCKRWQRLLGALTDAAPWRLTRSGAGLLGD